MRFAYATDNIPGGCRGPKAHWMRHHRHGGPGFGPGEGGPESLRRAMREGGFGPGGPGRGRRARRGNVRAAALLLLEEQPRNGYGLMQELEERTDGLWRPSPGAIYPALAQLEDEGLIAETEVEGKKAYALTDAGRAHVEEKREQLGRPWDEVGQGVPEGAKGVMANLQQVAMAAEQVVRGGSPAQTEKAKDVLADARKALYRLLAGDDE